MARVVSAREANQKFSEILSQAAEGETVVITRRGEPVAQLGPIGVEQDNSRAEAWGRLLSKLEHGLPLGGRTFDRDGLYERD